MCSIAKNKRMVSKECALVGNSDLYRVDIHTVAAQIFTHLYVVSSRQQSYDWLRCEEATLDRRNRPNEDK